jgi:uncharacterized membrane protein (DUF373 family)
MDQGKPDEVRGHNADEFGLPSSYVPERHREIITKAFKVVEDVVYIGLGILLAATAVALLGSETVTFVRLLARGELTATVVDLLDTILLILMIVEIMYTVQVSFRRHTLIPEPFLVVGLIAATRRILVLTAEFAKTMEKGADFTRNAMLELGLLTMLIVALVLSLRLLRAYSTPGGNQDTEPESAGNR